MSLQTFFDNFTLLMDAPNGIDKLRELILQLAVEGKLISQNPDDEPASLLFERIVKQRERLTKDKKIQKPKPLLDVNKNDLSFKSPIGWHATRLGQVFEFAYGKSLPDKDRNSSGKIPVYGSNGIVGFHDEALVNEPSLIVGRKGSSGAVNISNEPFFPIDTTYYVTPPKGVDLRFSYYLIKSLNLGQFDKATAIPGLNRQDAYSLAIALPPLEEQKRIVAKVDELMRRCDELEAQHQQRRESRVRLNNATLTPLNNAASLAPEEFERAYMRLAENFDALYDSAETVSRLRSIILKLAVQGKLVPQDETDEPIQEILKQLKEERLSLDLSEKDRVRILQEFERVNSLLSNDVYPIRIRAMCICDFITKGTTPANTKLFSKGEIPFLKVYNIVNNKIDFDYKPTFVSRETHDSELKRSKVYPHDVLMNIVGPPLGKVAIIPACYAEWNINQALAIFRPLRNLNKEYLYYALLCEWTLESVLSDTRGTAGQDNLSLEQCRKLLIPLYSPSHQKRIVAKVNQLMALCDELESKLRQTEADSERLMKSAVRHLLESVGKSEIKEMAFMGN